MDPAIILISFEDTFSDSELLCNYYYTHFINNNVLEYIIKLRECYYKAPVEEDWMAHYHEITFFQLFRMQKETFQKFMELILETDEYNLVKKKYRGGNFPVEPINSLLIFLWFMATQDTLLSIGQRFGVVPSTVMTIVNVMLYLTLKLKKKFIFWPRTDEEREYIMNGFTHYPGVLGAVDGSHINIKVVPREQHDSYVDRYHSHSINAMVISTADKILSYAYVGFPGSAHDARVFAHSSFVQNIEQHGSEIYFPNDDCHIIGDSAFPIKRWLMTPYKQTQILNRVQRNHNHLLSSDRVVVENIFARIKGRFRRIIYINTYSISKAVEIATAACVLHNFCYLNGDGWEELYLEHNMMQPEYIYDNNGNETMLGKQKRDRIARQLAA